jgi:hypothetical protein
MRLRILLGLVVAHLSGITGAVGQAELTRGHQAVMLRATMEQPRFAVLDFDAAKVERPDLAGVENCSTDVVLTRQHPGGTQCLTGCLRLYGDCQVECAWFGPPSNWCLQNCETEYFLCRSGCGGVA